MTVTKIIEMITDRLCDNCVELERNTVLSAVYFDECDTDSAIQCEEIANLHLEKSKELAKILVDIYDEIYDDEIRRVNKIKRRAAHIEGIKIGMEETEELLTEERRKIFEERIVELQLEIKELQEEG